MLTEDNTLVVPIRLEALAVNSSFKDKPVRRWRMNYARLLRQNNPEPPAFGEDIETAYFDEPQHWGVYLHWVVPEALRKGDQKDGNQTDFPPLPNRWLVARRYTKEGSGAGSDLRFWLIKSDDVDVDNAGGSTFAYIDQDGNIQVTKLGKSYNLENYAADIIKAEPATFRNVAPEQANTSPGGSTPVLPRSLNALGFGDVNFLAYQPLVNDVFSFHDNLKDIREGEKLKHEGLLSYFVAGWYSDPVDDVLHRKTVGEIVKVLENLDWTVINPDSEAKKDPAAIDDLTHLERTIYYGRRYRVNWQPATHIVDAFKGEELQIVFGNNALDAMLALLEKTGYGGTVNWGTLQFLKPFLYGQLPLLKEPGGFVRLNQEIRKTWFKAKSGGRFWVLESKDPADKTEPEVQDEAKELLEQVNARQEELEQIQMELEGLQKLLYDTWWQLNAKKNSPGDQPINPEAIEKQIEELKNGALAEKIRLKQKDVTEIALDIEKLFKSLLKKLAGSQVESNAVPDDFLETQKKLQENHGLIEKAKPTYWKPHDPTILISGLDLKASAEDAETLECRMPSRRQFPDALKLPDYIRNGILIALLNDFVDRQDQDACQWEQPWNPFFLEWEAEWLALPFSNGDGRFWEYTASDYEHQPPARQDGEKNPTHGQILRGRTFLTPQNNQLLQYQSENLKAMMLDDETVRLHRPGGKLQQGGPQTDGPLEQFVEFIDQMTHRRLLSQSLLDFNHQLQMRNAQLSIIPEDETLAELIGEQYQDQPMASPPGPFECQGIRQGHFKINKLQIYDGFGQCLVLVGPGGLKDGQTFTPIKDNNLTPGENTLNPSRLIELKPRILAYTRLRFDFLAAKEQNGTEDKNMLTGLHHDVNPIVGWVLYNHLDKSLVLFDNLGNYLGELRVVHGAVTRPDLDPNMIDPNIYQILSHIINLIPTNAQIFNLFLNVIDETLWTIEPNASLQNQHLAVWLGRPLALVRTRLKFEAHGAGLEDGPQNSAGLPDMAQNIPLPDDQNPVILKHRQQQFQNFEFDIRLGSRGIRQDGLIGYYLKNVFHTVHDLKAIPPQYAEFIQPIKEGNLISLKFSEPLDLTLLVDPRAAVYAQTGILPYTSLQLPQRFVDQALEKIQVNFRYHCLLTTLQKTADSNGRERVSMPLPALRKGTWKWIENQTQEFDIQGMPAAGKMPAEPALLRDGRLSLLKPFREEKKVDGKRTDKGN